MPPPSSRTVDPRLAAAGGVMRDTVGAIHNLQHLLGSMRVGPKALARVVPDVHASASPMVAAIQELSAGIRGSRLAFPAQDELEALVTKRMRELEQTLGSARRGAIRASDRLRLESAVAKVARDLDGALSIVELLVEASARGTVPVDVRDVIREGTISPDSALLRGRLASVTLTGPEAPISVQVNPRLALRYFAFAVALAADKEGRVHAEVTGDASVCRIRLTAGHRGKTAVLVGVPPLIDLSARCASEIAQASGATLVAAPGLEGAMLELPRAPPE